MTLLRENLIYQDICRKFLGFVRNFTEISS